MTATLVSLHSKHRIGAVDPRIFGGFLEHMGRAVYEGVYDPDSPCADAQGVRSDVLALLACLRMTVMRYPGGNFASGYHWEDGVGPSDRRPTVLDTAWNSRETNQFGTDEFVRLCRRMGWEPMLTVNLGTGAPEEARNWVEYCNRPEGTKYADLRASCGSREPYGVRLWCLGNEMDGPWQAGHCPAQWYAVRARQAAGLMKAVDPSIQLVACGSSSPSMKTYLEWDRQVLEYLGETVEYLSAHRYVGNEDDDTMAYLAVGVSVDRQIEEIDAVCRFVQGKRRSAKRVFISFDEWNVWYRDRQMNGKGGYAPHLIEEAYNLEDALVVASFLHSFVRHADCVRVANLAQIVNVIAPVLTRRDECVAQTIFYPFAMFSSRREGVSLAVAVEGPSYDTRRYGCVPFVDASAILGERALHLFLTNRDCEKDAEVKVESDLTLEKVASAELLTGSDPKQGNSFEKKDAVRSVPFSDGVSVRNGKIAVRMPPCSFVALTAEHGERRRACGVRCALSAT